jgi:hypothetical protein
MDRAAAQTRFTGKRVAKAVRFLSGELKQRPAFLKPFESKSNVVDGRLVIGGRLVVPEHEIEKVVVAASSDPLTAGGRDRLHNHLAKKYIGVSRRAIADVIGRLETNQTHKPVAKTVQHRSIITTDLGRAQVDLVDFQDLKDSNNGNRYALTFVELFSSYGDARPLKSKHMRSVLPAIDSIIEAMPAEARPRVLQSDWGSEFKRAFAEHMEGKWGIKVVHSSPYKPSTNGKVERFNRTLKTLLFRHMAKFDSKRWVDILPSVVANHNSSKSTVTGFTPLQVLERSEETRAKVAQKIREAAAKRAPAVDKQESALQVGDSVRVALSTEASVRKNGVFGKRLRQNWSSKIYTVRAISKPEHEFQRKQFLLSQNGRPLTRRFYSSQLQKIDAARLIKDVGSIADRPVFSDLPDLERQRRVLMPARPVIPAPASARAVPALAERYPAPAAAPVAPAAVEAKRGRGRPRGSVNRPVVPAPAARREGARNARRPARYLDD